MNEKIQKELKIVSRAIDSTTLMNRDEVNKICGFFYMTAKNITISVEKRKKKLNKIFNELKRKRENLKKISIENQGCKNRSLIEEEEKYFLTNQLNCAFTPENSSKKGNMNFSEDIFENRIEILGTSQILKFQNIDEEGGDVEIIFDYFKMIKAVFYQGVQINFKDKGKKFDLMIENLKFFFSSKGMENLHIKKLLKKLGDYSKKMIRRNSNKESIWQNEISQ